MNFIERLMTMVGIVNDSEYDSKLIALREALESGRRYKRIEKYDLAMDSFKKAYTLSDVMDNQSVNTVILLHQADILTKQSKWDEAESLLTSLREKVAMDERQVAHVLSSLGTLEQEQGNWEQARTYYEEARTLAQTSGSKGAEGRAAGHLADTYMRDGNASYSVHLLRDAVLKLDATGDIELNNYFVGRLGEALIATGQEHEGRQLLGRALRIAEHMKNYRYERLWRMSLAQQAMATNNYKQAKRQFSLALAHFDEESTTTDYIVLLCHISKACIRLGEYEDALGYARKAVEISNDKDENSQHAIQAQGTLGVALRTLNQYEEALPHLQVAIDNFENEWQITDADYSLVDLLRNLATVQTETNNVESALKTYERAIELAEKDDNKVALAGTYRDVGIVHAHAGNYAKATQIWSIALRLFEEVNDHAMVAHLHSDIANIRRQNGELKWAMKDYEQALTVLNAIDDIETRGVVLANAATAYVDQGDIQTAESFFHEAIKIAEQLNDRHAIATRRGNYGWFLMTTGRPEKALETITFSRTQCKELNMPLHYAVQTDNIGLIHAEKGQYEKAVEFHQEAIEHLETINDALWIATSRGNLAHSLVSLEQLDEAEALFQQALDFAKDQAHKEVMINALRGLARIAMKRDDYEEAAKNIIPALEHARKMGLRRPLADSLMIASEYHMATNQHDNAQSNWEEACKIYQILGHASAKSTPLWLTNE